MKDDSNNSDDETVINNTSSISSSSSSDEISYSSKPLPKRYKLFLRSDYKASDVSRVTQMRLKQKSEEYNKNHSSMSWVPLSAATGTVSSNETKNLEQTNNSDTENSNGSVYNNQYSALVNEHNAITNEKECNVTNRECRSNDHKVSGEYTYRNNLSSSLLEKDQSQDDVPVPNFVEESIERITNGTGSLNDYYLFPLGSTNEGEMENTDEEQLFSSSDSDTSADCESDTESIEDNDGEESLNKKSQHYFDKIMFAESNLNVNDVIILITAFSLDVALDDRGKEKLAEMIKVLAGNKFSKINLSKYIMNQCFSSQEENMTYNFYCSNCTKAILYSVKANEKKRYKEGLCKGCRKKQQITNASTNYFLSINLRFQIEQILLNTALRTDILHNLESRNFDNKIYEDVYSGSIHKSIVRNSNSTNEYLLTVNASTDGAPLTKSGKTGFWPVQVILNDLSPKLRFKNILISGLFLTSTEPKSDLLNLYLDTVYVNQIRDLFEEGIHVVRENQTITLKFCTHSFIVDAVARAIVQNRIQFNGYHGCSFCYQLGEYFPTVRGVRYPVTQDGNERTNQSHRNDVKMSESGNICNGVKGPCALQALPNFDMVWSFPYEYLHSMLLGTTLTIWNEWKKGGSEFKLSKAQIEFIEKRFLNITPTGEIHRMPRSGILKGTAKPKGSELKSWLLFYSLPCLYNVLNEEALDHFSLFVRCSYTLLTTTASDDDLDQCEIDLLTFVVEYAKNYGEDKITYNVHIMLHIIASIRKTGPICCNSAIPFESNIYTLKTFVSGPKFMDRQIARKHLQTLVFKTETIRKFTSSEQTINFCANLFNPVRFSKSFHHGPEIAYCGKSELKNIPSLGTCAVYKKCIYKSTIYHSEKYMQAKKTNNSIVQVLSGEYGRIVHIVDYNNKPYFQLRFFKLFPNNPFKNVDHIKKIESEYSTISTRPISDIKCKIMLVNVRNARYLCHLPNTFEIQ